MPDTNNNEIHVYGFCENKCRREVMLKTDLEEKFSEIDTALEGKAASAHNHDDRYYTEAEVDTKLEGKSDTTHTHGSMSTITYASAEPTSVAAGEIVMVYEEE